MKLYKHLHWLVYILFTLSCARQTTPTGGPKDTIPPNLDPSLSRPLHEQVNFSGQQMELTFDEALLLNNAKEQMIITPSVGKDFEALVKKNKVIITFKNPLLPNTTYSVNFRDAIQDITEKNPVENLRIAFSTGDYLDSLSIDGKVISLLEAKEIKDATVALYESDTFNIFKHKPSYLTKTNDKGDFQISNLKPGTYYIYAVQDNNKNLITDSKSEAYAFKSQPIRLDSNVHNALLPLVRLDARPLKLTIARPAATYFNIKCSKNLQRYTLKASEGITPISSFGADHENIRVYNNLEIEDSIAVNFHGEDSLLNKIDTSLYVKFTKRTIKPEAFEASNNGFFVSAITGTLQGSFTFNKPIISINTDSIYYSIDSLQQIHITRSDISYDTSNNILTIHKAVDKTLLIKKEVPKSKQPKPPVPKPNVPSKTKDNATKKIAPPKPVVNQLFLGKGAFVSVEADSTKGLSETLTPLTLETTGMLHVDVKTKEPNYIVDLISKGHTFQTKKNTPKITFVDLPPGDYQIRVTIDKNNDGKWSPGNYYKKEEPESIIFYKTEKGVNVTNLRANYEIGPLLITF